MHLLIQHDEYLVKSIQHYTNHDYCHHPLCIAIRNSDVTVAAMLCESGARLFNVCRKEAPLQHTLCKNSVEELLYWRQDEFIDILPRLLPENINQSSLNSFLVDACSVGCTRAVRLFMSKGADVNGCNEKGFSPIYAASAGGIAAG